MRSSSRTLTVIASALLAASLAACSSTDLNQPVSTYPGNANYPNTVPVAGVEFGRITNIEYVQGAVQNNGNSGTAGTLIGGVAGGLLGNTVGGGGGRAAATVLGAVGGAVIGNRIARNRDGTTYTGPAYRVTVQGDGGSYNTYEVSSTGDLRVGDRVRVDNGVIYRS